MRPPSARHPLPGVPPAGLVLAVPLPRPWLGWGTCPGTAPPAGFLPILPSLPSRAAFPPPPQGPVPPPWAGLPAGDPGAWSTGVTVHGVTWDRQRPSSRGSRALGWEHLAVTPPPRSCRLLWLRPLEARHSLPTGPRAPTPSSSSNRRDSLGGGPQPNPAPRPVPQAWPRPGGDNEYGTGGGAGCQREPHLSQVLLTPPSGPQVTASEGAASRPGVRVPRHRQCLSLRRDSGSGSEGHVAPGLG